MNGKLRLKVAMAIRVRDLLVANPLGSEPADQVSAQFVKKVGRAELLLTQQESGDLASRTSTQYRRQLRKQMLDIPVRHVVKIAKLVAVEHPDVSAGMKRPPFGQAEAEFQASVRAIVQQAETHRVVFMAHGMSSGSLDELGQLLQGYQQAVQDSNAARRAHTGARAELHEIARELMRLVQALDGIVLYNFRDNPEFLGAWASARNVAWPEAARAGGEGPATVKSAA